MIALHSLRGIAVLALLTLQRLDAGTITQSFTGIGLSFSSPFGGGLPYGPVTFNLYSGDYLQAVRIDASYTYNGLLTSFGEWFDPPQVVRPFVDLTTQLQVLKGSQTLFIDFVMGGFNSPPFLLGASSVNTPFSTSNSISGMAGAFPYPVDAFQGTGTGTISGSVRATTSIFAMAMGGGSANLSITYYVAPDGDSSPLAMLGSSAIGIMLLRSYRRSRRSQEPGDSHVIST
jgi:hypothetical protein